MACLLLGMIVLLSAQQLSDAQFTAPKPPLPVYTPGNMTCPPPGQYYIAADTWFGGWHMSSNATSATVQAPFSSPLIPVEDIYSKVKQPINEEPVCDKYGRCITAYEIHAQPISVDLGFRGPNGEVLKTDLLGYDGQIPGPTIYAQQGVQTLVRLVNDINCSSAKPVSNNSVFPTSSYYQSGNWASNTFGRKFDFGLTMHLHGSASLSPFDGWAQDLIHPCESKDYVFPNEGSAPIWYHDHADMWTEQTVEHGLFAGYYIQSCEKDTRVKALEALGKPVYMFLHDHIFLNNPNYPGKMNTYLRFAPPQLRGTGVHIAFGDHNMVNGKIFPNVQVQRKAYRWIFINGASYRLFNLQLQDENQTSIMGKGFFTVVGTDGGLRQQPVPVTSTLLISPGERYEVVVDFSQFEPGTVLFINNPVTADSVEPNVMFCYSHLVMRITVGGTKGEPTPPAFESNWVLSQKTSPTVVGDEFEQSQIEELCSQGLHGKADRRIQTTGMLKGRNGPFMFADMDTSAWNSSFVTNDIFPLATNVKKFLPTSVPLNGYEIWEMYNNVSDTMFWQGNINHPMHVHLVEMIVCGRRNAVKPTGLKPYELMSAKDTFLLGPNDNMIVLIRFGPHIGSYMFHCHNLGHEDIGLMGALNVSDVRPGGAPTPTKFPAYAHEAGHYEVKFANQTISPLKWNRADPLVYTDNGYVGRDLFFPDSMPAKDMKRDPNDESKPQPINKSLLKKVLQRNYYEVFYPKRKNLQTTVKGYRHAVKCDA